MLSEKLKRLLSLLPDKPGVYQMKDKEDAIIYIGKAKNLKKRVSQYFLRPQAGKVASMVSHVDHFDFIVVSTEKEAFILEMNLIQTHYPRYNILLMDDSHYPYIALKRSNDPMLKIARSSKDPHYFYFGPFPSSSSAYETIRLINKLYPTRKCTHIPNKPCLYHSLGQCLAPCIKKIEEAEAARLYAEIKKFLGGDIGEVKAKLKAKMLEASDRLDYETAAEIKKSIDSLDYAIAKQSVELTGDSTARDVFAFAERESYRSLAILTYRRGILLGKVSHVVPAFGDVGEQMGGLILQYYQTHETPKEIVARVEGIQDDVESIYEGVHFLFPKEGRLLDIIHMAELNAREALDRHFLTARLEDDNLVLLEELGTLLGIKTPYRIELFDNSHLQGSSPVGAMVCFVNGASAKKMYRKFHLSEETAGDDYASMRAVVGRRYSRLKEEGQSFPDLILADGGLGQVHATLEGLEQAGVSIPVFGLYKNEKHQTEGLIDKDGKTYPIPSKSPLFFLLMRMQDEVHRFAISFHREARSKAMGSEIFDGIPGIGAKRKQMLHKHYPTLDSLLASSLSELAQILPLSAAEALYAKLHTGEEK
ncbi:MAG: excinuclease ABC subunit C [Bacilli bacterium]|nr:excinuclease ABC subunit C [Bacilli bacterium]